MKKLLLYLLIPCGFLIAEKKLVPAPVVPQNQKELSPRELQEIQEESEIIFDDDETEDEEDESISKR